MKRGISENRVIGEDWEEGEEGLQLVELWDNQL